MLRQHIWHQTVSAPRDAARAITAAPIRLTPPTGMSRSRAGWRLWRTVPVAARMSSVSVSHHVAPKAHAMQQRAVGDAGGGHQAIAAHHSFQVVDLGEVTDAEGLGEVRLASVSRISRPCICPPMQRRARRPTRLPGRRRCPDRCPPRCRGGWWCDDAATSTSVMSFTEAPTARTAAISAAWRGRSRTSAVISDGATPLASANARMLSSGLAVSETMPAG